MQALSALFGLARKRISELERGCGMPTPNGVYSVDIKQVSTWAEASLARFSGLEFRLKPNSDSSFPAEHLIG